MACKLIQTLIFYGLYPDLHKFSIIFLNICKSWFWFYFEIGLIQYWGYPGKCLTCLNITFLIYVYPKHKQSNFPGIFCTCTFFREKWLKSLQCYFRYNIFTGCPEAKTCTLIMRGGAEQFIEETERSLHDAIMIVRRAIKNDAVVAGGGAIEMELSKYLRDYSRSIAGKEQLLIGSMARALEIIPRQLCDNAGFDATNILNKLRQRHFQGKKSVSTSNSRTLQ